MVDEGARCKKQREGGGRCVWGVSVGKSMGKRAKGKGRKAKCTARSEGVPRSEKKEVIREERLRRFVRKLKEIRERVQIPPNPNPPSKSPNLPNRGGSGEAGRQKRYARLLGTNGMASLIYS